MEYERKFLLQNLADPTLDRILQNKVQCPDHLRLADTVHPPDTLFHAHGIPRQVVVYDHVAELQIQALAAGVRGNQDAHISTEPFLDVHSLFHGHAAVQAHRGKASAAQVLCEHFLGGDELGEDENLQIRIGFFLLQCINPFQQGLSSGIRPSCLYLMGKLQQSLDFFTFIFQCTETGVEERFKLDLGIKFNPILVQQWDGLTVLILQLVQDVQTAGKSSCDGPGGGCDQALHEDHEETNVALVLPHGLIVGSEIGRRIESKFFTEVGFHFGNPLSDQAARDYNERSGDQTPELQFPQNQTGFDGLSQSDFIGQEEADPVARDRLSQCLNLVRQRDDRCVYGCKENILSHKVRKPGCHKEIAYTGFLGLHLAGVVSQEGSQIRGRNNNHRIAVWEPYTADRRIP